MEESVKGRFFPVSMSEAVMKKIIIVYRTTLNIFLLMSAFACVPLFRGLQDAKNLEPPQFVNMVQPDERTLLFNFDQPVNGKLDQFIPHGDFSLSTINAQENMLEIVIQGASDPGREYFIEGTVHDQDNNALWFLVPFYGFNRNPARLLLSEFISEHSSRRYEKVELYVSEAGNLGGLTVYNGATETYKSQLVFSSQDVEEGEYLIVHFRSLEGDDADTGQIDEYGSATEGALNRASSAHAIADVRDFWAQGDQGLSNTNGGISIYKSPARGAELMDALLYSNRSFDPDDSHGSFGTAYTWKVMQEIFNDGGWIAENEIIQPEDCLRIEASTSTRSINRGQAFSDSNSPADWHIVPTGESSFGSLNSNAVYEP